MRQQLPGLRYLYPQTNHFFFLVILLMSSWKIVWERGKVLYRWLIGGYRLVAVFRFVLYATDMSEPLLFGFGAVWSSGIGQWGPDRSWCCWDPCPPNRESQTHNYPIPDGVARCLGVGQRSYLPAGWIRLVPPTCIVGSDFWSLWGSLVSPWCNLFRYWKGVRGYQ